MELWYPHLAPLDVPTPATAFVPLSESTGGGLRSVGWNHASLVTAVEATPGDGAFLRTDLAAASQLPHGSFVDSTDPSHVRGTAAVLVDEQLGPGSPPSSLAVRERLDLNAYEYRGLPGREVPVAPEVRAHLDDGLVTSFGLRTTASEFPAEADAETELEYMAATVDREAETVRSHARTVAETFDTGHWALDLVRTADGSWVAFDMGPGSRRR